MAMTLPKADILVVTVANEFLRRNGEYVDPTWSTLAETFGLVQKPQAYSPRLADVFADLRAHKLFAEDANRFWALHPRLDSSVNGLTAGRFAALKLGARQVVLYSSAISVVTGGPTVPAVRALRQVVAEVNPSLIVHVGLAGGVRRADLVGDVVVSSRARFELDYELGSFELNEQEFDGRWTAPAELFNGIQFPQVQEPAVLAPSPNYAVGQPLTAPPYTPSVRVDQLPVHTSPTTTDTLPRLAPAGGGLDKRASALDQEAAATAACVAGRTFVVVLGLPLPLLANLEADHEGAIRRGWARIFWESYSEQSAANAASVAHAIVEAAY